MSKNDEHDPFLHGEDPGQMGHVIAEQFHNAFENANRLKNFGHEVVSKITSRDGEVHAVKTGSHLLELTEEEEGHFLLRLKDNLKEHKGVVAAGILVTGAAVFACIKGIRQIKK